MNPAGSTPANPLIDDAGANADAAAAVIAAAAALTGGTTTPSLPVSSTSNFGGWVNSRQEMQIGESYATTTPGDLTDISAFILEDPIDAGATDPRFLFFCRPLPRSRLMGLPESAGHGPAHGERAFAYGPPDPGGSGAGW